MKILVVSDLESQYIWSFFSPDKFNDIDLIISCGDVKAEFLSFLVTMIKAPLFYVPGNHNTSYINTPPDGCQSIDGKILTFNGIKFLGLGGSMRYNDGNFQYTEKQMEKRISKLKTTLWWHNGFDILITHSPAYGINDGKDLCHTGFRCFNNLIDKYSPKYFFHGHQHLNYGNIPRISTYKNTTIVNAYDHYIIDIGHI